MQSEQDVGSQIAVATNLLQRVQLYLYIRGR